MDLTVNNVSFGMGHRILGNKAPKRFAYLLALGLSAMSLNSCDFYMSDQDVYKVTTNPTNKTYQMNDTQLNIVKNYYKEFAREPVYGIKLYDNKLKIYYDDLNNAGYNIQHCSPDTLTLERYVSMYNDPSKMVITKNETGYQLVSYFYDNKNKLHTRTVPYDFNGKRLSDSQLASLNAKIYANKIQNTLDETKFFDENDTRMLSAIVSSWGVKKVEYLDLDGGLEIFADGKNATYDIVVRKTEDGSYWGIMNKLLSSANLQSSENESSSQTYIFKTKDKSTAETERMAVTVMNVARGDVNYNLEDDINNNQPKYLEGSSSHHEVNDYKVAYGSAGLFSGGGVDIMATDEKTFTTRYLIGAESIMYTLDSDNQLKINGKNAFAK